MASGLWPTARSLRDPSGPLRAHKCALVAGHKPVLRVVFDQNRHSGRRREEPDLDLHGTSGSFLRVLNGTRAEDQKGTLFCSRMRRKRGPF